MEQISMENISYEQFERATALAMELLTEKMERRFTALSHTEQVKAAALLAGYTILNMEG